MLLFFLPKRSTETSALVHLSCLELCFQQRTWQIQARPSTLILPSPRAHSPLRGMVVFLIQQLFLQKILITIVIQLSGAKSFITFSICDPEPFIMYWLYY